MWWKDDTLIRADCEWICGELAERLNTRVDVFPGPCALWVEWKGGRGQIRYDVFSTMGRRAVAEMLAEEIVVIDYR